MDFGYGNNGGDNSASAAAPNANANGNASSDVNTGQQNNDVGGTPATDIDGISDSDKSTPPKPAATGGFDNGDSGQQGAPSGNDKPAADKPAGDAAATAVQFSEGDVIEHGENKYTVDATGNVVDKDGAIFKEAKDVKDWVASFEGIDDGSEDTLSIATIQSALDIELVDDNGQPLEFENTPAGVRAYINAVNEANREEHYEEAINTLYQKYPVLPDVLNYYVANGNSLDGYGELPDRSNITIEDTNETQHENIIRMAFEERGQKGVDNYIQYLKSSGTLLATAKEELEGLQQADATYKEEMATKAQEAEAEKLKETTSYWAGVKEAIDKRVIGGYQIPDTIIINKDGQRISVTPNDFYNYIYNVDKDGRSAYDKERSAEPKEARRDDEMLRAFLKFTGGTYSNLVEMAVNKDKVNKLKVIAKTKSNNSIKVTKAAPAQTGPTTDFGY